MSMYKTGVRPNGEKTMKAKVLDFVEKKGKARYTDIIKFIVTEKFGPDAWDRSYVYEDVWVGYDTNTNAAKTAIRRLNTLRGYYSASFNYRQGEYFLKDVGYGKLQKGLDGLYTCKRPKILG